MQAIRTKYLGPTNHKPARVVAECEAKRKVYSWSAMEDLDGNRTIVDGPHRMAALSLARELGWIMEEAELAMGALPDGSFCHVIVAKGRAK